MWKDPNDPGPISRSGARNPQGMADANIETRGEVCMNMMLV
jgi:hypothetical protein